MTDSRSRTDRSSGARRPQVHVHSLTLVPASLLPFKNRWQPIADALPRRDALIIVPSRGELTRRCLARVVAQLRADGRCVTILPAQHFY